MKREIVFRGKSDVTNKFVFGDLVRNLDGRLTIIPPFKDGMNNHCDKYEIDENTIGQFTGLKDKNDKEIYEGDIVKTPMGNIGIIKFGTHEDIVHTREATRQGYNVDCFECTGWIFENIKTKEVVFMDSSVIAGDVIGNIYDNPELLKQ